MRPLRMISRRNWGERMMPSACSSRTAQLLAAFLQLFFQILQFRLALGKGGDHFLLEAGVHLNAPEQGLLVGLQKVEKSLGAAQTHVEKENAARE